MVHLSAIPKKAKAAHDAWKENKTVSSQLSEYADTLTTSVYGSKFADEDLPRDQMPEGEMPRDIAYRMIRDELSLDGNPKLK